MALSIPDKQPSSLYRWNSDVFSDDSASFSDIVFGFSEQPGEESSSSNRSCSNSTDFPDDEEEEQEDPGYSEEKRKFWESRNELVQSTLYRTTSVETKIRQDTKDALIEIEKVGLNCTCGKSDGSGCRNCLRRDVAVRLQSGGHNCTICKSKWRGNCLGLSGEHPYLEVVENSPKRGEVRVIIELNFRAEFEMARANEEYNQLIGRLPEVFVGRVDRLKNLIKTLCSAAEACSKENKIHLAPWRKHEYMKSKWFGTCERFVPMGPPPPPAALPAAYYQRPAKPRASMLTYDLLENNPFPAVMHLTAVRVV